MRKENGPNDFKNWLKLLLLQFFIVVVMVGLKFV